MILRSQNRAGSERFRSYLAAARGGSNEAPPSQLLEHERFSAELPVDIEVDNRLFRSRLDLGAHLHATLARLPLDELDSNPGLWTWLSLFWFDQLCPRRADGSRRPGLDYRHVADFAFRTRYRHLLYGPYLVYRRHGTAAEVLLLGPLHQHSQMFHIITGIQDMIANRSVIEAAALLYMDPLSRTLKSGCQTAKPAPGTIRRFVRVLQQLDLTHDIDGMSGQQLLEILPPEFDAWRPAAPLGHRATARAGTRR